MTPSPPVNRKFIPRRLLRDGRRGGHPSIRVWCSTWSGKKWRYGAANHDAAHAQRERNQFPTAPTPWMVFRTAVNGRERASCFAAALIRSLLNFVETCSWVGLSLGTREIKRPCAPLQCSLQGFRLPRRHRSVRIIRVLLHFP